MVVKTVKQCEGEWTVYETSTMACAEIIAIQEFGFLAPAKKRYRVDYNGTTQASMIENFQTAKSIATKIVKGNK